MNASAMEAAAGSSPSVVTLTLGPTSLMSAALQLAVALTLIRF
jgi:hypothetical protein